MATNNAVNETTAAIGKLLQSQGVGVPSAFTTATYPSTAGASGNVLTSDGTNWISSSPASQFIPNSTVQLFDDFMGVDDITNTTALASKFNWVYSAAGPQWVPDNTYPDSSHPGVVGNSSMTSNNRSLFMGNVGSSVETLCMFLGGGIITLNWVFKIATASNPTNRYVLRCGLGDTNTTTADQVNGVYFEYSNNINGSQWVYKTASASTRTTSNSTTSVTAAYHNAQIVINAAASSVSFSIDGVSLGTAIATNIPTTALTPFFELIFAAGTIAAGSVLVDLFYMTQTLTNAR